MELIKMLTVYFFSFIVCLAEAQPQQPAPWHCANVDSHLSLEIYIFNDTAVASILVELKLPTNNVTKTAGNPIVRVIKANVPKNGRDSLSVNKKMIEPKPVSLSLDPKGQLKLDSTPKPQSMQMPFNYLPVPRGLPIKVPLVAPNISPASAQYVRLKADSERKKALKPKTEVNKELPRKKVTAVDKGRPKSNLNLLVKPKKQKQTSHKHKYKSQKHLEGDNNLRSLPPAHKRSKTRKNKKIESNSKVLENLKNGIYNDTKYDVFEIEGDSNLDEDIFKNQTHAILITELLPDVYESESKEELNLDQNPPSTFVEESDTSLTPNNEEVINNDDSQSTDQPINMTTEPIFREHPVITLSSNIDVPDIIIKGHEYEEIEEKSAAPYPEQIPNNEDLTEPIATASLDTADPYNNYLQKYQSSYDKYVKYLRKSNPNLYENENCYPRASLEPFPTTKAEFIKTFSSPEGRIVQDIYGPRPGAQSNVIDIRPENALGRIWRTWKDTEIKIKKPKYYSNKPLDFGRNINEMNYGEVIAKTPAIYGPQSVGLNGYYNNLNNAMTYPYAYPAYRYNMM